MEKVHVYSHNYIFYFILFVSIGIKIIVNIPSQQSPLHIIYMGYYIMGANFGKQSSQTIPCFSYTTLQKILSIIPKKIIITLKSERKNKRMIKAKHEELGELEFTSDHPFYYKEKYIDFEELIKVNPKFYESEEMLPEECDTLYNIVGHPDQTHIDNIFILSDDLHMIGAQYPQNSDPEFFLKKKNIFEKLLNDPNPENIKLIREKYGLMP